MKRLALIGCGAVIEFFHAPCLAVLSAEHGIEVSAVVDPSAPRRAALRKIFPNAAEFASTEELLPSHADAALIASPPRFHASQSIDVLRKGMHVLCEKPMAATVAEGEAMLEAARNAQRVLIVGLMRRFFPTSRFIRETVREGALGKLRSVKWGEGGPFGWAAASPSFFQKKDSSGGVLADLGVHCIDLLLYWLGDPEQIEYEDDAMGGLESNCRVTLTFPDSVRARLRLSRDSSIPNYLLMQFERGSLRLDGPNPGELTMQLQGSSSLQRIRLEQPVEAASIAIQSNFAGSMPPITFIQAFAVQLMEFVSLCRSGGIPTASGTEGLRSMKVIEQCYRERQLMPMPWFSTEEYRTALTHAN